MGLVSSIVSYVSTLAQNAGVVPAGTNVASHARASDGAEIQDVYLDNSGGDVSVLNSSEINLAPGEVFEGTYEDVLEYGGIRVAVYSSHASANRGLEFWCSKDGVSGFTEDTYTIPAANPKTYAVPVSAPFFKVRYTNGSSQTTTFKLCVIFQRNVSVVSSHRLGDTVTDDDDATLVQTVLKAKRQGQTTYQNLNSDVAGNLYTTIGGITQDAGGRVRVSQLTTLGDYKMLDYDRTVLMDTVGTGSGSWANNKYTMSVQSGEYLVRYSKRFHPYFSGKSQMIEMTCDNFGLQANVEKMMGGFSSSPSGTYSTEYDGFVLRNTGATYVLEAYRKGVKTVDEDWTGWDNYDLVSTYNFNNFSVFLIDYLWLGGAVYRLWLKNGGGFILLHTVHYSGTAEDVITLSPNQPVRYEIRSSTGTGMFRYICSQVSTEGSINESGLNRTVNSPAVTGASIGTTYPVKAIRKKVSCRDIGVSVEELHMFLTSANDQAIWSLQINPTLSAPLTYSDVTGAAIQAANGNGTITVTSPGVIIASSGIATNAILPTGNLKLNFLSYLGSTINNTMDEYVLCMTPITAGVTSYSGISYKEI